MDCKCEGAKRSYHVDLTEVVDGKIQEVFNFNLGGHHDIAAIVQKAMAKEGISEKHAQQLVLGLRLMHHALKKNPDNELFAGFLAQLNEFKKGLKGKDCQEQ